MQYRIRANKPQVSSTWSPVFISSDINETRSMVGRGICDHVLEHHSTQKRPVTVHYRSATLSKLTFHEMEYKMHDGEARIFVPDMAHFYLCEINLKGNSHVGQQGAGSLFTAGQIYMANAHHSHTKRWETDGQQIIIRIHQTDIERVIERSTRRPITDPVIFSNKPQQLSGKVRTLYQMVDLIRRDIEIKPSFFASNAGCRAEDLLIELILSAIPNNYSQILDNQEQPPRPRHVRYAAEYIHLMAKEKIKLDDLVNASGVSTRSLHAGFKKYYNLSPMKYLQNVRLDLARNLLKHETSLTTSVTHIAMSCGFVHLSRFSSNYEKRFGELPLKTLKN
jgi:AraC-like DNA-binding protein